MAFSDDIRVVTRLDNLQRDFDAFKAQDKPGSTRFTAGYVPFGDTSGKLTSSAGLTFAANTLNVSAIAAATSSGIEVGGASSGNRSAFIDLHGDDTYTDYSTRLIRGSGGPNAFSVLNHRGTGGLQLNAEDAGFIQFMTNGSIRGNIHANGIVNFFENTRIGDNNTPLKPLHLIASGIGNSGLLTQHNDGANDQYGAFYTGQAGVLHGTAIAAYNYYSASAGASSRISAATGAAYIRLMSSAIDFNAMTAAGVSSVAMTMRDTHQSITTKLRIGDNTNPTRQLELSTDSAGRPGTNTWSIISDEQTKRPATRPYVNGLQWLLTLPKPVYFQYNGEFATPNTDEWYVGFRSAQDVQKVAPDMIRVGRRQRNDNTPAVDVLELNTNEVQFAALNALAELNDRLLVLERRTPNNGANNTNRNR